MTQEPINSPQNEKLKLVRRLAELRGRAAEGLFVSEGEDLLGAGLDAGWEPRLVLVAAGSGIDGVAVQPQLIERFSALGSGTRAIALWPLPDAASIGPDPAAGCIYLHGVADPGNVGAIIRSATALTGSRVVLGSGCADPFSPKATRASMGALFANPPRPGDVGSTPGPRLALSAHGGSPLAEAIAEIAPKTICLGAEREGLDEGVLGACEAEATIALRSQAESLNVAATAAIVLHRICSSAVHPHPQTAADKRDLS